MFLCEQQEEEWWKETDTYTASTRYWMRDVTYQNLETYQNWKCLIENRISRHLMLKTYLRWSHKLQNPKLIFKNCRIKAYFDAIVYNLLNFKAISPFFKVFTVWLYTPSQCIGEQNQLGLHIIIHWRSYALGFCRKQKNLSQVKDSNNQIHTIQSYIAERYLVLIHSWRVYAILLLCWDTRCLITMLSYTQQKYIVVVYSTLIHCWNTPNTNTLLR